MAEHLSDEEQIESLKRWWKENGTQLILTVALVIGSWFGWQQWQGYRDNQAAEASATYSEIMELVGSKPMEGLNDTDKQRLMDLAELLRVDHKSSQYADYASMLLARLAVAEDELETAAELLQQVIDTSVDDELSALVRIRLARVKTAQKHYLPALEILDAEVPVAMTSLVAELRGDIHFYLEDFSASRAAYQLALSNLSEAEASARPMLELKLNRVLDGATVGVIDAGTDPETDPETRESVEVIEETSSATLEDES